MRLTPHEQERLMVHVAALLAASRRERVLAPSSSPPITPEGEESALVPGEALTEGDPIVLNLGCGDLVLTVENTGERPVQVGRSSGRRTVMHCASWRTRLDGLGPASDTTCRHCW